MKTWWMSPSEAQVWLGGTEDPWKGHGTQVQVVPMDAVVGLPGSWLWAVAKAREGKRVCFGAKVPWELVELVDGATDGDVPEDGWYELPPDPPPWKPERGERVRGWCGVVEVIGPYLMSSLGGWHSIGETDAMAVWAQRVEPLSEEARG